MKTRFFALAALAVTLAACNKDNNETLKTDWTDGDRIGVTGAGFTNVPYKRENGKFVTDGTTIYFNDTETKTFNAYYPYQAEGGTVSVSTATDKQGSSLPRERREAPAARR